MIQFFTCSSAYTPDTKTARLAWVWKAGHKIAIDTAPESGEGKLSEWGGAGMGAGNAHIGGAIYADMADEGGHSPPRLSAWESHREENRLQDAVNGSCGLAAGGGS